MSRSYQAPYVRLVLKARAWRRVPMRLLKWTKKMPSTNQYDLVPNDEYDTRIPLHPDEAFQYGITFQAKYIGTMDVPRPTNRVEIVAAMRRVRYEFKAKGVKKRKVTFDVSTNGVRVTTRKKKSKKKNPSTKLFGRSNKAPASESQEIMHHPIYRIFYVSHDSSDLKIFSYIARDGATNVFKCNVFKSNRKSQAMRIVRTVGQAFEVCHKMQGNSSDQPAPSTSSAFEDTALTERTTAHPPKELASECGASESGAASTSKVAEELADVEDQARLTHLELLPPPPKKEGKSQRSTGVASNVAELPECVTKVEVSAAGEGEVSTPLSAQHQLQLLRERLEQQAQQTRAAVAQLLLLRDQLAAEQAARCEAQARTHQLLVHNKELLEHIAALVAHLQERERGSSRPISAQQLTLLPQFQQNKIEEGTTDEMQTTCNGNRSQLQINPLVSFNYQNLKFTQNLDNNNVRLTPRAVSPHTTESPSHDNAVGPNFGGMTNEQIQNYLISKFQNMNIINGTDASNANGVINNQDFFQNSNAFQNIPPLKSHFSNSDLESLLHTAGQLRNGTTEDVSGQIQTMSVCPSQISLCSNSQTTTSKDSTPDGVSSDDGIPFIMPLSHNGTLTATGDDGRVRLIVPVSPSPSTADVQVHQSEKKQEQASSGITLNVPGTDRLMNTSGPIIRTTSEKVPNCSEMMTALRSQWTRHTTK